MNDIKPRLDTELLNLEHTGYRTVFQDGIRYRLPRRYRRRRAYEYCQQL